MSYRVILIDDEPWTLVYLKKTFKWDQMGFEVIAEIKNSEEAIDIICRECPDVVFTDIRMPKMSGLELMQRVKEKGINSTFIIISGFAEFSYAQEAVKLGAFEYCLKPISFEKADEILTRLKVNLDSKKINLLNPANTVHNPVSELITSPVTEADVNKNFKKMLKHMQVNLNKKLQLKEVAKEFYLNPNYCCFLFNKNIGKTFSEFLTDLRMKEAVRILEDNELTIEEAAKKTGYDDYFYFNKVFKKYHGVTPAEYRKKARN